VLRSRRRGGHASGSGASGSGASGSGASALQQRVCLRDYLVSHPAFLTGGLGFEPWQHELNVTTGAAVHVASQHNHGAYGYAASRCVRVGAWPCAMLPSPGPAAPLKHTRTHAHTRTRTRTLLPQAALGP
jgi:hypothetical protein